MATAIHPRLLIIGDDTVKESLSQVSVNHIFTENRFFLKFTNVFRSGSKLFWVNQHALYIVQGLQA
jgi:hypothetical protein